MRLLVFAKAPEAGRVKTRLIPALGAVGAAELHRRLVRRALTVAAASVVGPVELWCAPDVSHPFFRECGETFGCTLRVQHGRDLGARMCGAMQEELPALLMGSDAPALDANRLRQAAAVLGSGAEVTLIPALDGGYVAIGLAAPAPSLFDAMPWGSAAVLQTTVERCRALGLRLAVLEPCPDLDRPDDLCGCPRELLRGIMLPKQK